MKDEILDEKFRQMTLQFEQMHGEFTAVKLRFIPLENRLERLTNEVILPSGKVMQRLTELEKQIKQLGEKAKRPAAAKKHGR